MEFSLGHIESPEAELDRMTTRPIEGLIGSSTLGIDDAQDLREWAGPVESQVGNSCCIESSFGAIESRARKSGIVIPRLSRKFGWTVAQWRDQERRKVPFDQRRAWDQGTRIDMLCLALREHGIPSEARCPWEPGDLDLLPDGRASFQIPIDVDIAAADALLTGDHGVDPTIAPEVLRMAMRQGHFPILAIDVDQEFMDLVGRDVEYDGVAGPIKGGHAMMIVGSRPGFLLAKNSWGTGWGDEGYVWLTDRSVRGGRDACVFTATPNFAQAA